jgi:Tol biopolymer transport system component
MTFEKSDESGPIWSPDGQQIIYFSDRHGQAFFIKNANGTEAEQPLFESKESLISCDWSSDGKYFMFQHFNTQSGGDLSFLPMKGDRKPAPFLQESYEEGGAAFSSDGRWVAYESRESGTRNEIFIRPFPSGSGKWQISTNGGRSVRWRHDGREIYYRGNDGAVYAVEVNGAGSTFVIGKSVALFKTSLAEDPQLYDVTPDGQRFLIGVKPGGTATSNLKIVTYWEAEGTMK